MATKNPRAGSAGASLSIAADKRNLTPNHPDKQPARRQFRVVLTRGLWRGCIVQVEPATCNHQMRSFPDYPAAIAFAEELAKLEGWPLVDRVGGAE